MKLWDVIYRFCMTDRTLRITAPNITDAVKEAKRIMRKRYHSSGEIVKLEDAGKIDR